MIALYEKEETIKCYEYFKPYFKSSVLIETAEIREYAIKKSLENDKNKNLYNLEFGVYVGTSINFFSKYVNKIYGFDSFEGLKEDWVGYYMPKGTFNLNKKIQKLNNNVTPVVGWVQDTLDIFLETDKPEINFVHIDVDTYESTKFILEKIKPYLVQNSIILFDELYNFPGWDFGEHKALMETFEKDEFQYLAFSTTDQQVVIKITKKDNQK